MDRVIISAGAVPAEKLDFRAIRRGSRSARALDSDGGRKASTVPAGYRLQVTTTPDSPASWTFVTDAPIVAGGSNRLYTPITQPAAFTGW